MTEELENNLEFEAALGLTHFSDQALAEYNRICEELKRCEKEGADYALLEQLYRRCNRQWEVYKLASDESIAALRAVLG